MTMRKKYSKPFIKDMEATAISLMTTSPLQEGETTGGGGVHPGEEVNTGMAREHRSLWDE